MKPNTIFVIIVFILILLFVVFYFIFKKIKMMKNNAIGKNGEKKVSKVLDKLAKRHGFLTIHDLYLPLYDKTTQIDHVLLGEFGVLVIETKSANGEIYGNEQDENWTQIIGTKKHSLYNPLKQNKTHVDCMRHLLRSANIYKVQVDSLVVFSSKTVILNIPKGMPVITLNLLKKYLKKPRYKQDNQVDIQKLHALFLDKAVSDKALLKKHNANVQKMSQKK